MTKQPNIILQYWNAKLNATKEVKKHARELDGATEVTPELIRELFDRYEPAPLKGYRWWHLKYTLV